MDIKNGTATFVMPHWSEGDEASKKYIDETIDSIIAQTDDNWQLIIVDDLSPSEEIKKFLETLKDKAPGKIHIIYSDKNQGPGVCRNIGIDWAAEQGSPFVLFNDADDISHKDRLKISRQILAEDSDATVVYTTFDVIDENSNVVPREKLSPSIIEIIDSHKGNPPQGENAWIAIATETGYTNLTSATTVRIDAAKDYPFPPAKVSEDSHTWMRYAAGCLLSFM
jgi:glycosyltransferase involved in cell wall biosynthesis